MCSFYQLPSSLFGAAASDAVAQVANQDIDQSTGVSSLPTQPTNGLIIILEDGDITLTAAPAQAIFEKASPLIISSSIIAELYQEYSATEFAHCKSLYNELTLSQDTLNEKDRASYRRLEVITTRPFNAEVAAEWIIKEINPSLYLLLHKSYLVEKKISEDAVTEYNDQTAVTAVEMQLGLKVNHMKTVTARDIKKPTTEPELANYFLEALRENLFVHNFEYTEEFSQYRSAWSIFILGHGMIDKSIAGISIDDFKTFLSFLEKIISTKLLYYLSCYGAGKNSASIYKTSQKGVTKTYPFAIITQALTDAAVDFQGLEMKFGQFLHLATTSDCINYKELATYITPDLNLRGPGSIPQIKFPGLEWFSVIDESKVASIGSILAKTRTEPLDIGTFFKKKGKQAQPLAILLYARDTPFELKIDSSGIAGNPPAIISMIPETTAFHTIKKISSRTYSTESLMNSISNIAGLEGDKTFVIEEIEGLIAPYKDSLLQTADNGDTAQITLEWVVVDQNNRNENGNFFYYTYKGLPYEILPNDKSASLQSHTERKAYYLQIIQEAMQQQHPSEQKPPAVETSIEKKSTHEHITPETMKALGNRLANKEKREAWLKKFADTLKSDTESWIKVGTKWIKTSYKNTERLVLYYLHQRRLEQSGQQSTPAPVSDFMQTAEKVD